MTETAARRKLAALQKELAQKMALLEEQNSHLFGIDVRWYAALAVQRWQVDQSLGMASSWLPTYCSTEGGVK